MLSSKPSKSKSSMPTKKKSSYVASPKVPEVLLRKLPQPDADKEVVAVIITISRGNSYDPLFTDEPQVSPDGSVAVYSLSLSGVPILRQELQTPGTDPSFGELMKDIASVEPDCVVLNFECCSGIESVPSLTEEMLLTRAMLDRQHMVMYSDFSLKALIRHWDESLLGPKALEAKGVCGERITLHFSTDELKECPSAQLVKLAELCAEGEAEVSAMSDTIVFAALSEPPSAPYEVQVLTVATALDGKKAQPLNEIGSHAGTAGHVLLKYRSGGLLLCSAGHWHELTRINTTEENVMRSVQAQYGEAYAQREAQEYAALGTAEKKLKLQSLGARCIKQSAPCKSKKKSVIREE